MGNAAEMKYGSMERLTSKTLDLLDQYHELREQVKKASTAFRDSKNSLKWHLTQARREWAEQVSSHKTTLQNATERMHSTKMLIAQKQKVIDNAIKLLRQ